MFNYRNNNPIDIELNKDLYLGRGLYFEFVDIDLENKKLCVVEDLIKNDMYGIMYYVNVFKYRIDATHEFSEKICFIDPIDILLITTTKPVSDINIFRQLVGKDEILYTFDDVLNTLNNSKQVIKSTLQKYILKFLELCNGLI